MISVQSSPSSSLFSYLTIAGFPAIRKAVAALWAVKGATGALGTFAGGSSAGGLDRFRSVMHDRLIRNREGVSHYNCGGVVDAGEHLCMCVECTSTYLVRFGC